MSENAYDTIAELLTGSTLDAHADMARLSREKCEFPEIAFNHILEFLVCSQVEPQSCKTVSVRKPEHRAIRDVIKNSILCQYLECEYVDSEEIQIRWLDGIPIRTRIELGKHLSSCVSKDVLARHDWQRWNRASQ